MSAMDYKGLCHRPTAPRAGAGHAMGVMHAERVCEQPPGVRRVTSAPWSGMTGALLLRAGQGRAGIKNPPRWAGKESAKVPYRAKSGAASATVSEM